MAHGLCWLLLSTPCVLPLPQLNKVHVYRLITKKTYESEMFRRASRKLGLSQAVFETGGIQRSFSGAEEPQAGGLVNLMKMDKNKVCALARRDDVVRSRRGPAPTTLLFTFPLLVESRPVLEYVDCTFFRDRWRCCFALARTQSWMTTTVQRTSSWALTSTRSSAKRRQ